MQTMRVAQIPGAKLPFEIVERPIPEPSPGTVRIKVAACGICHSESQRDNAKSLLHDLVQIEHQHLRLFRRAQFQCAFLVDSRSVAAAQCFAVERHFAFRHVNPRMTSGRKLVRHAISRIQLGQPQIGVLMDGD